MAQAQGMLTGPALSPPQQMALEWLVHDQMRRDMRALPDAIRVAMASSMPSKIEDLFPDLFKKADEIRLDEVDPEELEEAVAGKEVVFEADMPADQAEALAALIGQGISEWTVTTDQSPPQGVDDDVEREWL